MANWQNKITIENWYKYDEGECTLADISKNIVAELNRIRPNIEEKFPNYLYDLDTCIQDFEMFVEDPENDDVEEFDFRLNSLYDFGDITIGSGWPQTKLCWIERK